jgi:hypothetical protein
MALPFVNTVAQSMPGFGSPSCYGAATIAVTTAAAYTVTIAATTTTPSSGGTPFNANGGPAPTRGKIRFRLSTINASTVVSSVLLTVTDGTTIEVIDLFGPVAAGVATNIDYTQEFTTDLNITSVSVVATTTTATTASTLDVEVSLV